MEEDDSLVTPEEKTAERNRRRKTQEYGTKKLFPVVLTFTHQYLFLSSSKATKSICTECHRGKSRRSKWRFKVNVFRI